MPKASRTRWSWSATAPVIMTVVATVISLITTKPDSLIEFWRNVVVFALLIGLGWWLSRRISEDETERDRKQTEMITGGDNFCYLTVNRMDLQNGEAFLRLWIKSTGLLMNLSFHISPADSKSGHDDNERYFYLRKFGYSTGATLEVLQRGSKTIGQMLKADEVREWRVQFSARNGGWTQWLSLTKSGNGLIETTKVIHDDGHVLWPPED